MHAAISHHPSRARRAAVFAALTLAGVACLGTARAQLGFSDFAWVQFGEPSASVTVDEFLLHVIGPDGGPCSGDGTATLQAVAPTSGWVIAQLTFVNLDEGFGWWTAEDPITVVDGDVTYHGPGDFFWDPWNDYVSFHVMAGQSFGFGVKSVDCQWGPGVLDVSDFKFLADVWDDLGGALTGSDGDPSLKGIGPLLPGSHWTLSLVDTLPNTTAWMVLGTAQLGAPFKGGTLVPDPSPPALLLPLGTGPGGRIILEGTWPADAPAGVPLVIQYWVADPAGPVGFAASNGVTRISN